MAATTIYALSSGALPAGVAVVRISGPKVPELIPILTGSAQLEPRLAALRSIRDGDGSTIDQAICLFFPAPASFTGEDVLEVQLHGSRAVVAALFRRLEQIDGVASADPGEFTMRAFLNGRIDLTAAEALSDLIVAETEAQRKLALQNADGAQRRLYESWRAELLDIWARVEADLDFSDQDDVPLEFGDALREKIAQLATRIEQHVEGYRAAEIVNDGFHVVIAGPPNAGKSSLLNMLANRDVAIVTDLPGTTRDLIEVRLDVGGRLIRVTDTAGLRDADDPVERIGIERARAASALADMTIFLDDGSVLVGTLEPNVVRVSSKADLRAAAPGHMAISTVTGQGIPQLLEMIANAVDEKVLVYDTVPSKMRQVEHLTKSVARMRVALDQTAPELIAEELRQAATSLGRLTGMVDVEELLGNIFSKFCIGK